MIFQKVQNLFDVARGRVISKGYIKNHPGKFPVYSSQTLNDGILGKIATHDYDGEYLTWTANGVYAGTIFYRNGQFSANTDCGLLKLKDNKANIFYLFFVLKEVAKIHIQGMVYNKLSTQVMKNIPLPIPSRPIQDYIAQQLQTLDDYFNQYLTNLKKETGLRKQQFQYYEKILLDFSVFEDNNLESNHERERERERERADYLQEGLRAFWCYSGQSDFQGIH